MMEAASPIGLPVCPTDMAASAMTSRSGARPACWYVIVAAPTGVVTVT